MARASKQLALRQHKDIEPISKRNMRAAQATARAYPRTFGLLRRSSAAEFARMLSATAIAKSANDDAGSRRRSRLPQNAARLMRWVSFHSRTRSPVIRNSESVKNVDTPAACRVTCDPVPLLGKPHTSTRRESDETGCDHGPRPGFWDRGLRHQDTSRRRKVELTNVRAKPGYVEWIAGE